MHKMKQTKELQASLDFASRLEEAENNHFPGTVSEVHWLRTISMATRLPSKTFCTNRGSSTTDQGRGAGLTIPAPHQGYSGQAWPVSQQASSCAPLGNPWVCSGLWMLMLHFTEELVWVRTKICKGAPLDLMSLEMKNVMLPPYYNNLRL